MWTESLFRSSMFTTSLSAGLIDDCDNLIECSVGAGQQKEKNKAYTDDYAGAIAQGYVPCKNCNPTG